MARGNSQDNGMKPRGDGASSGQPPRRANHRAHRTPHRASSLSKSSIKNEINVTPLVDVVLVLLIIFMVVTPMLSRGVSVDLPETRYHDKKPDTGELLVVSVRADGQVFVESDPVNDDNMVEMMRVALKSHKSGDVHVKGDRRAEYGKVRKVLERLHEAGAPSVALGSEEVKQEGN